MDNEKEDCLIHFLAVSLSHYPCDSKFDIMKQINHILILLLLCCITACNDWLEVAPQAEKKESEMFEKEAGFRNVLIGAYIRMKSNNLYGEDLTYGSIEMLAQHWTSTDDLGKYLKAYNYEQSNVETKINSFYGNLYKVIADVNGLLNNIDARNPRLGGAHWPMRDSKASAAKDSRAQKGTRI